MKKSIYLLSFLFVFILNAQKNKNGTVYDKHPAIDLVGEFNQAWVSGDIEKAASFLTDDFRVRNGNSVNKDDEGANKQQMVGNMTWWYNNNSYLKFTRDNPAYPDAIEYKKGNSYSVIDQGYSYLSILLNNKADFILEYNETQSENLKKTDIQL